MERTIPLEEARRAYRERKRKASTYLFLTALSLAAIAAYVWDSQYELLFGLPLNSLITLFLAVLCFGTAARFRYDSKAVPNETVSEPSPLAISDIQAWRSPVTDFKGNEPLLVQKLKAEVTDKESELRHYHELAVTAYGNLPGKISYADYRSTRATLTSSEDNKKKLSESLVGLYDRLDKICAGDVADETSEAEEKLGKARSRSEGFTRMIDHNDHHIEECTISESCAICNSWKQQRDLMQEELKKTESEIKQLESDLRDLLGLMTRAGNRAATGFSQG